MAFDNIPVIGTGNMLMRDEGGGVRAVEEVDARYRLRNTVRRAIA